MSSTVAQDAHAKALADHAVMTRKKAAKWAGKLNAAHANTEEELLKQWEANFESLKKYNKNLVDAQYADVTAQKEAEAVFVETVKDQLSQGACSTCAAAKTAETSEHSAEAPELAKVVKAGRKSSAASATSGVADATSSATGSPKKSRPKKAKKNAAADGYINLAPQVADLAPAGDVVVGRKLWSKSTLAASPIAIENPEDFAKSLKRVVEADGTLVKSNIDLYFLNWGATVRNKPQVTFEPKSRTGVQNIIQWARRHGKRVRACGYRHTWTNMYGDDNQVLISMIPVSVGTNHLVLTHDDIQWNEDDLEGIQVKKVLEIEENGVKRKQALCKIGASTTNEQFRRWCLRKGADQGNWNWSLPLNVIMVEITFGGSNAPICHGAGIKNQTLSDLVYEIEFVNPKGLIQRVSDPAQLRAASGAFGLLGIVTAVTLRLDEMSYARMLPSKTPVMQSVPPPANFDVPTALRPSKPYKAEKMKEFVDAFESHCKDDSYAEWFWFPLQQETWNNCWQTQKDGASKAKPMSECSALSQGLQGILGQAFNETLGQFSGWLQTQLLAKSAMGALPAPSSTQLVPIIDALHFRRGINNMRVVDMELEIPIPDDGHGKPDWNICRRAWWDVIALVYKYEAKKKYPLRVALEMRVMGGSNVIMAPQYGNKHGTCSIEVLTTPEVSADDWAKFMQEVSDLWYGYEKEYKDHEGNPINVRSHWAKQWESLKFDGLAAVDHFRSHSYKDRIPEFLEQIKAVSKAGGYKLGDLKERFSTPLLDRIFFYGDVSE